MQTDRDQTEPAGKSFSRSNTLLKKFVWKYTAAAVTIFMMFASVAGIADGFQLEPHLSAS